MRTVTTGKGRNPSMNKGLVDADGGCASQDTRSAARPDNPTEDHHRPVETPVGTPTASDRLSPGDDAARHALIASLAEQLRERTAEYASPPPTPGDVRLLASDRASGLPRGAVHEVIGDAATPLAVFAQIARDALRDRALAADGAAADPGYVVWVGADVFPHGAALAQPHDSDDHEDDGVDDRDACEHDARADVASGPTAAAHREHDVGAQRPDAGPRLRPIGPTTPATARDETPGVNTSAAPVQSRCRTPDRRTTPHISLLDRSLFVDVARVGDRLWAAEAATRSPAIAAVIVDGAGFGLTETRRLQLAAQVTRERATASESIGATAATAAHTAPDDRRRVHNYDRTRIHHDHDTSKPTQHAEGNGNAVCTPHHQQPREHHNRDGNATTGRTGGLVILARPPRERSEPSAAMTRWLIAPRPAHAPPPQTQRVVAARRDRRRTPHAAVRPGAQPSNSTTSAEHHHIITAANRPGVLGFGAPNTPEPDDRRARRSASRPRWTASLLRCKGLQPANASQHELVLEWTRAKRLVPVPAALERRPDAPASGASAHLTHPDQPPPSSRGGPHRPPAARAS
jgi:hypothetical protein